MVSVVNDMVQRDTVIFGRSFEAEGDRLTVAELKSAIQAQKVLERDVFGRYSDIVRSYGVGRSLSKCCTPGLRM